MTGSEVAPTPRATRAPALPSGSDGWGRWDVVALVAEIAFVAIAALVGAVLLHRGVPIHVTSPPLAAKFRPHAGVGTPIAMALAALVVWRGSAVAYAVRWSRLMPIAYAVTVCWIVALALIDGWHAGIGGRLTTPDEYLANVDRVTSIRSMLATFTRHILSGPPDAWTTHVAGHPPGALLVFVLLDRAGLGGGTPAAVVCIIVGALAPVCVATTLRGLGADRAARAALPFLVLFPGAVWVGVSADGLFMGVVAAGVALLVVAGWRGAAAGGVLLGLAIYLSYGLVLVGVLALAVWWTKPSSRGARLIAATAGAVAVVTAFTVAGFWWPTGYHLVVQRYYQGWGAQRPYGYWVWADLAALVACAGPVLWPALRRAGAGFARSRALVAVPPLVAAVAIVAADLSGLSKAEVERIWLPFAIWLLVAVAFLPDTGRRRWLAAQALVAILINSLLWTAW